MFISISLNKLKGLVGFIFIAITLFILSIVFIQDESLPSHTNDMEFIVVVDPGHGSIDTGTSYGNLYEKDINLDIARSLNNELKQVNIVPIMTRTEDKLYMDSRNKDIRHRPLVANENNADLFISIHTNNFPSSQPQGSQLFYKRGSEESKKLAEFIQQELVKLRKVNDRVIKTGDYYVLNKINCPGVIIEVGFMSNSTDRRLLAQKDYQQKLARAITTGIVNYFQSTFIKTKKELPAQDRQQSQATISSDNSIPGKQEDVVQSDSYLYYINENQDNLFLIKKELTLPTGDILNKKYGSHSFNEILAIKALEQLAHPPEGLLSPLPAGNIVNSLRINNKIAVVDFSGQISKNFTGGAEMELQVINAITKTLLSIPGIEGVEILIDGEKGCSIGGHLVLNKIYK